MVNPVGVGFCLSIYLSISLPASLFKHKRFLRDANMHNERIRIKKYSHNYLPNNKVSRSITRLVNRRQGDFPTC